MLWNTEKKMIILFLRFIEKYRSNYYNKTVYFSNLIRLTKISETDKMAFKNILEGTFH